VLPPVKRSLSAYVERSGVNVLRKILIDDRAVSALVSLEQSREVLSRSRTPALVEGVDDVIEAGNGLITC
jgi:hypothetical protein